MRAEAHLHITRALAGKEDCISLRKLPNYQVEYAGYVVLKDVTFAVQPAGLKRFRDQGQKNVHAFVRGELVEATKNIPFTSKNRAFLEAKYNPKVNDTFVDAVTGAPITSARGAIMIGRKVFYIP